MNDKYVAARMPQEMKNKWVAALRSGEYEQGFEMLYNQGRYCCLGVLQHVVEDGKVESEDLELEEPCDYAAPLPSAAWADGCGIKDYEKAITQIDDGTKDVRAMNILFRVEHGDVESDLVTASELNDEYDYNFVQIADLVEEQVEGY